MKKGVRYIITSGEYSDYGICDSFVALRDFSFDAALEKWLETHGDGNGKFRFEEGCSASDFLATLRASGCVADEPTNEVHFYAYGRPEKDPAGDRGDEP